MRVLLCLDMPMRGKLQRQAAANFRRQLSDAGFTKLQENLFMKIAGYREQTERYVAAIKHSLPNHCKARVLTLTEKQYDSIRLIAEEKTEQEIALTSQRQLVF